MARHLSVVVILAIAAFVVLSFMTSFGGRTERIQQILPNSGLSERPPVAPEAPASAPAPAIVPDLKPEVTADSKLDVKPDTKPDAKPDAKPDVKPDAKLDRLKEAQSVFDSLSSNLLSGGAIAPKLENATLK